MRRIACALLGLLLLGCSHQAPPPARVKPPAPPPAPGTTAGGPPPAAPQAMRVDAPYRPTLVALHFADATHGWAAGAYTILATADGGRTWQQQYNGAALVQQLAFADAQHGWALASDTLLRTDDGGRHWTAATLPFSQIGAVLRAAPGVSWVSPGHTLYRTDDGGAHWTDQGAPTTNVQSLCFTDARSGWAASEREVWRTADGGVSWQRSLQAPNAVGARVATVGCAADTAWVRFDGQGNMGHYSYAIYATADAGQHWRPALGSRTAPSGLDPALPDAGRSPAAFAVTQGAAFFLAQCWACGGYGTLILTRTADGGKTWQQGRIEGVNEGRALSFPDPCHGWLLAGVGGTSETILATSDGGQTWAPQYPVSVPMPNGAVDFVTADVGFGLGRAGQDGAILRTADGGQTWQQLATLPGHAGTLAYELTAARLSFADARHGWAIGPDDRLHRTADGGENWEAVAVTEGTPVSVQLATAEQGCVTVLQPDDRGPAVLMTSDGGKTWQAGAPEGGVAGCTGRLLGQEWRAAPPPGAGEQWRALPTRSAGHGWAVPANGYLLATSDSGKTWTGYAATGGGRSLQSLSFLDRTRGWGITGDGLLVRTTDGGASWQSIGGG